MDDTVLKIFSGEPELTLMIYLVTCLGEEAEELQAVLIPFLKICLEEEHKDLVVSEDKEDLICCTKPLFRLKMY